MEGKNKIKTPLLIGVIIALVAALVIVVFYYNGRLKDMEAANSKQEQSEPLEEATEETEEENDSEEPIEEETEEVSSDTLTAGRSGLLTKQYTLDKEVTANTAEYKVEPDLSNIYNIDNYWFNDEQKKLLADNYFYVDKTYGDYEFFELYERNRYYYDANFVTVDSLMHTYHLFFSHLLKNLEKDELSQAVSDMSEKLLKQSDIEYLEVKGTEWESAAKRNVEFFAVANAILGNEINVSFDVADVVEAELTKINEAEIIEVCEITGNNEDYTQYKPRGYYEGDELLEKYFKVMMWYGRIQFNTKDKEMIKSAALMNLALNSDGLSEWKDVYDITSFFVGASDDLGYYEYYPLLQEIYGKEVSTKDLVGNTKKFDNFIVKVKELRLPEINSMPIYRGEDNVIPGFRLMGQRFTIDATIMQKLVYSDVERNSNGELRMLPSVLDVTAVLGSEASYKLLEDQGEFGYDKYKKNLDDMISDMSDKSCEDKMGTTLYGNWMSTLRPLLKKKGTGYPMFMQSDAWEKRDIECFAGSYTELKHDTVLYAKQVMAEMGDGEIPEYDDRGYVQPEPEVYSRFMYLADATREGLKDRCRISSADEENLRKLSELAGSLYDISVKELQDELLSDEEFDLIREYGGTLEHFWYDVMSADIDDTDINTEKYQAALCVDVATDPNGQVLEMATGRPCTIYVVVNVDGVVKIATGKVYSFYEFSWPMDDRLTDSTWREMMGWEPKVDGFYDFDESEKVDSPWWTKDYTYVYSYNE